LERNIVAVSTWLITEQVQGQLIPPSTIAAIIQTIVLHCQPLKVLLFGSYANGNPTPDSDLDLLIVMDSDLARHKRATPIRLLFRPMPCSMDILVFTPQEVLYWNGTTNHIITEAFQTGRVLYDSSAP
jgi:uncharacterized protein